MTFWKHKWTLRRTNGRHDSLWQFFWVWCRLLVSSGVIRSNLFWLIKLPGREFKKTELLLKHMSLDRGVHSKAISAFAVFQVPVVQNNQYIWGWCILLPFSYKVQDGFTHLSKSWCCLSSVTTWFSQLSLVFLWARPASLYNGLRAVI